MLPTGPSLGNCLHRSSLASGTRTYRKGRLARRVPALTVRRLFCDCRGQRISLPTIQFISGPALGHFGRIALVARSLRERIDCTIRIAIPSVARFDTAPFEHEFAIEKIPLARRDLAYPAPAFADALDRVFRKANPDLVVQDCCPARWLATARFPECPRAVITNGFLTRIAGETTVQTQLFAKKRRLIRKEREKHGLPPLRDAYDLYEADRVLLADPQWLLDETRPLPEAYRVCGALWWEAPGTLPAELAALDNLLLCSMGSTGALVDDRSCALAAERFGCDAILRVHSKTTQREERMIGRHRLYQSGVLPLGAILPSAGAVMTQGGAGSTYQALAAGKPLAIVPSHRNHRILGRMLEARGVAALVENRRALKRVAPERVAAMRRTAAEAGPTHFANTGASRIADHLHDLLAS